LVENEFQWVYLLEFDGRIPPPNDEAVLATEWHSPADFYERSGDCQPKDCVPYGTAYFALLLDQLAQVTRTEASNTVLVQRARS
jgi:hypothetical protein